MDFTILIGSCDKYHFLWNNFSYLFHKYWDKEIDVKKYIITQESDPKIAGIETVMVGDPTFGRGVKAAIDKIKPKNILWLQDDYFLRKTIDKNLFEKYYNLFEQLDAHRFGIHVNSGLYNTYHAQDNIFKIQRHSMYTISLQASLWKADFLYNTILDQEDPWQFEVEGTPRLNHLMDHRIFFAAEDDPPWYLEAHNKGQHTTDYYNICKEEGLHA